MKKIILALFIVSSCKFGLAQDTSITKYLPLQVGNVWVYYYYASGYGYCNGAGYDKYIITGTVQANGKTYFVWQHSQVIIYGQYVEGMPWVFDPSCPIRVDSVLGNFYKDISCGSSPESLGDSLRARLHDSTLVCNSYMGAIKVKCTDTSLFNIFGQNRPSKSFGTQGTESGCGSIYVKGVGSVNAWFWQPGPCNCQTNLKGCVINGVLYGDTSIIVGLHNLSSEIPKEFDLSQNYPNPFNPVTRIKFSVPLLSQGGVSRSDGLPAYVSQAGVVKLRVYDVLGREVETLVDQNLSPGTYEVEWDSSNYSSGVYFYQLTVSSEQLAVYRETKRMVLIK